MALDGKRISELARVTAVGDSDLLVIDKGGTEVNSIYVCDLLKKGGGAGISDVDGISVTLNSNDQIQTVGVIDQNTATANKFWTGTKAEYDAIVTKDADTIYNITDDVSVITTLLEVLYPVGSIYISTNAICPLSTLISGSSWVQVASGKVLQGSDLDHTAGTTIEAGLPNITSNLCGLTHGTTDGAFTGGTQLGSLSGTSSGGGPMQVGFSASDSNAIYGNSTTVQPPAYVVNIFRRIA